ncbi:nitrogen permease regulator 2 [Rhizopogon salebrosus TDB-379]|nr:nitrogen permease regulator 2 [Rhizopogon salebrosus TDB-379]
MPSEGDTFLPRIQSVFYAVFDLQKGPKIVYQPPRSSSSTRILFNFDDISKYVIPPGELCGRLVICTARKYRVIGFPVLLPGNNYKRNYFQYNVCFVFERSADLSCYEPIVRKVSRILTACEEESSFLSCPQSSPAIHAILEQLYEDLNSYSETSIPIDAFNSIELKIFPFYPNPPPVTDWQVPLALINLSKRIEGNWDLTMSKVCRYIDGVNHVSRIAHLADCDPALTRQAISHLLYYQVIMTVDIFQYSNVYTLRKNVQWLADESHVKHECGPYVTKPGSAAPDWPKLLHLYSRLKSGKTVLDWMESYNVHELGIDVRRFTSFGVIKGFLRRVHRWPILLPADTQSPTHGRRSSSALSTSPARPPGAANIPPPPDLLPLLDGDHHTDELCTRFEVGWPQLQQWLVTVGGGKGDGDFGRVSVIYR